MAARILPLKKLSIAGQGAKTTEEKPQMKYDVVTSANFNKFIEGVNASIEQGWEPLGGIAITERGEDDRVSYQYCQAMILKEDL